MKLVSDRLRGAAVSTASSSGKRRKKQLLLEPPPPSPPPPQEKRVANDDADNGTAIAAANHLSAANVRVAASNAQRSEPTSPVAKTRTRNSNNIESNLHHLQSSAENLNKTQRNNKPKYSGGGEFEQIEPSSRSLGTDSGSRGATHTNQPQQQHIKTSVIKDWQRPSKSTPATTRRRFEELRHCFDFNRMYSKCGAAQRASLMMAGCHRDQNHHDHHRNADDREQRQQQKQQQRRQVDERQPAVTTIRPAAGGDSRRKSELTSFLTILFGFMLAVLLLLASSQQILCGQSVAPLALQRNSTSMAAMAAAINNASLNRLGQQQQGKPEPAQLVNASSTPETEAAVPDRPRDGSRGMSSTPQSPPTISTPPAPNADDNDYEDTLDSSTGKAKLGDLLTGAARDGTDLLINHLQSGGSPDDDSGGKLAAGADLGASGDEAEPGESMQLVGGSGSVTAPLGQTGTNNSTEAAVASPLAAVLSDSDKLTNTVDSHHNALDTNNETEQTRLALETYEKWRAVSDDLIELFSRKLMPIIIEHGYDVDSGTVAGLLQAFNGIRQIKPWALKLLDAWTKLSPGVLMGTQSDFGDFDECLNVRVDDPSGLAAANSEHFPANEELDPLTGLKSSTLVGRYCLADVEFPKPARRRSLDKRANASTSPTWPYEPIELRRPLLDFKQLPTYKDTIFVETGNFFHMLYVDPIRVGICLTNKIDPESFQTVFNKLLEEFRVSINIRGRCVTKYDRPVWTSYQRVSAYILVIACSLVVLSTCLDVLHAKLNKLPCPRSWSSARLRLQMGALEHRDLFTSFSLLRNTRRLFKQPPNNHHHHQTSSCLCSTSKSFSGHHHHQYCHRNHHLETTTTTSATICGSSASAVTAGSSIAESSVESSPSIERRSSADTTTSSTKDLISLQHEKHQHCGDKNKSAAVAKSAYGCSSCFGQLPTLLKERNSTKLDEPTLTLPQVSLSSLHGIRVITMVWMIVNHTYMFGGFFVLWAYRRLIDIAEWPKSLSFQMVLNGWLTVETYFFLSALIIAFSVLPLMRSRKFNYFTYIIHRLLRLLPAYVGLVCLNFLWPLISSGPVWLVKGKSFVQDPCENYLWSNFLFINNWFWPEKQVSSVQIE
jgi:hypothetical protein